MDPLRLARRSTYPPDAGICLYERAPVAGEGCVEVERNHERKENPNTTLKLLVSLNGVGYYNMLDGGTNTVQLLNFLKKLRIQSNLKRPVKVGERCLKSTLLKWELSFYIRLCTLQISIPRNCMCFNKVETQLNYHFQKVFKANLKLATALSLETITMEDMHNFYNMAS